MNTNVPPRIMQLNAWWFILGLKHSPEHKRIVKLVKNEMKSCGYPLPKGGHIALQNAFTKFLKIQNCWVSFY